MTAVQEFNSIPLPFQPKLKMPSFEDDYNNNERKKKQWSPYNNNLGTVMAIAGTDFCVVSSDTRLNDGYQILSREVSKVTQLTKTCVIASSGCRADIDTLHKHIKADIFNYKSKFGKQPSAQSLAQLLSTTLYYKRFFPYYAFNLLCGLNLKGEGVIYGYDAIGSYDQINYGAQGSGQELLMSVLDNQFKGHNYLDPEKPSDRDKAVVVSRDVMNSCAERDIHTGDYLEQFMITSDGVERVVTDLRKD